MLFIGVALMAGGLAGSLVSGRKGTRVVYHSAQRHGYATRPSLSTFATGSLSLVTCDLEVDPTGSTRFGPARGVALERLASSRQTFLPFQSLAYAFRVRLGTRYPCVLRTFPSPPSPLLTSTRPSVPIPIPAR